MGQFLLPCTYLVLVENHFFKKFTYLRTFRCFGPLWLSWVSWKTFAKIRSLFCYPRYLGSKKAFDRLSWLVLPLPQWLGSTIPPSASHAVLCPSGWSYPRILKSRDRKQLPAPPGPLCLLGCVVKSLIYILFCLVALWTKPPSHGWLQICNLSHSFFMCIKHLWVAK